MNVFIMSDIAIELRSNTLRATDILSIIETDLNEYVEGDLFLIEDNDRGIDFTDPQILIALITAGNAAISALIIGIFKTFEKKQEKVLKVEVEVENGGKISFEYPNSSLSVDELHVLINESLTSLKAARQINIITPAK